jgi:hypothetical protein
MKGCNESNTKMALTMEERNQNLMRLSQLVVHDTIYYKLDKIAEISIHGMLYFTVYRRYNSVYEYILEYINGDYYLHKNGTVRESLQKVLSLSEEQIRQLYTHQAFSYKYNAMIETMSKDLADDTWYHIAKKYGAVSVDFRGVLDEFHHSVLKNEVVEEPYDDQQNPNTNVVIDLAIQEEPWVLLQNFRKRKSEALWKEEWGPMDEDMILRSGRRIRRFRPY